MCRGILLLFSLLSLTFGSSKYQLNADDRAKILSYHNQIRANYKLPLLEYDLTLEQNSTNYASGCFWGHSTSGGKYGENLAQYSKSPATSFPLTTWLAQINGWYTEYKYWSCPDNGCSSVCGHLTQIISAVTTHVGCGIADCDAGTVSSMRSQYMVCQYTPPGNFNLKTKHPVSNAAYPYTGCPMDNPVLADKNPLPPPPPTILPTAPVDKTPNPPAATPAGGPTFTPTFTPVIPPVKIPTGTPVKEGCKGDYWTGSPPKQKITDCVGIPRTFSGKLYCDVRDPLGKYWPVINPGTPGCPYVAKLEDDDDATANKSGSFPWYGFLGIALGFLAIVIIGVIIAYIIKKRRAGERV